MLRYTQHVSTKAVKRLSIWFHMKTVFEFINWWREFVLWISHMECSFGVQYIFSLSIMTHLVQCNTLKYEKRTYFSRHLIISWIIYFKAVIFSVDRLFTISTKKKNRMKFYQISLCAIILCFQWAMCLYEKVTQLNIMAIITLHRHLCDWSSFLQLNSAKTISILMCSVSVEELSRNLLF